MDYDVLNRLQEEGIAFLLERKCCILADDVGLGKTKMAAQAIEKTGKSALVITFGYLKSQWLREINEWTKLKVSKVSGPPNDRATCYARDADVYVINYELLLYDLDAIKKLPVDILVLDEGHAIKSFDAKRSEAVMELPKTEYRWVLTATPVDRFNHDIYNPLVFVCNLPVCFGQVSNSAMKHQIMGSLKRYFKKHGNDLVLRRSKDILGLPPLVEEYIHLEMPDDMKQEYQGLRDQTIDCLHRNFNQGKACFTNLRQYLGAPDTVTRYKYVLAAPKVEWILNFIDQVDGKVIIFSDYRSFIHLLSKKIKGSVKLVGGMSEAQKELSKRIFKEKAKVLLCTQTGELGHNLQYANYLVNVEVPFTPKTLHQRIGRIHRTGQTKTCFVYNLVMDESLEEQVHERLNVRKDWVEFVMNQKNILEVLL